MVALSKVTQFLTNFKKVGDEAHQINSNPNNRKKKDEPHLMPRIHRDIILRSKAIPLQCLWLDIIFCAVQQGECPPTSGQLYGAHLGQPLIRYFLFTLFSSSNLTHGPILYFSNYYSLLDCILKNEKKNKLHFKCR